MKKIFIVSFFINLYKKYKLKQEFKKKLKELKKRDPFVYKNF
jgi:hypothetical protein